MRKMTRKLKQELNGGIGPMMIWVLIIGAVMVASTVMQGISQLKDTYTPGKQSQTSNNSYTKRNNGYLRLSPFPARSAIMMGM